MSQEKTFISSALCKDYHKYHSLLQKDVCSILVSPSNPSRSSTSVKDLNQHLGPSMSVGLPSDEVAEDYKKALEDLTANSRYEISNLTVIAKENTEHALAISRVLENHIKNVSAICS